ncbi:MAG: CaiB/BaiF CoA transferase family protein [Dehalococcoidia bacterium]
MRRLPLAGVRVADVSQVWAGPHCSRMLADLGAEVIKVESIQRMDPVRGDLDPPQGFGNYPDGNPGEHPYNRAGSFNAVNLNKLGITLNLQDPRGVAAFQTLVAISDVVIENFSLGVMDRLGIGYAALRAVRPDLIMLSMPGFGSGGPESSYLAYGIGQEQLSGMVSLTGYGEDTPMKSGINVGDPISALHGVSAILGALFYRRRTGIGQFIELSHLEANIPLIGESVLEYTMNQRNPRRIGNRHPRVAPHGCYPTAGEDTWVTIACFDDSEFRALCQAMELEMLADDLRFATMPARTAHQDELDAIISAWTRQRTHYEAMHILQAAGVAAGAVLNTAEVMSDPQIVARGFFEEVTHPEAGTHAYPGVPYKLSGHSLTVRRPAPMLGEQNAEVLLDLLGIEQREFEQLERDHVVGTSACPRYTKLGN